VTRSRPVRAAVPISGAVRRRGVSPSTDCHGARRPHPCPAVRRDGGSRVRPCGGVLAKIRVVRCWPINSARRSYTSPHASLLITGCSGTFVSSIARSRARWCPASMMVQAPSAVRKRATSSMGFCVADNPIRVQGCPHSASSRASVKARWLPRLLDTSAWISSTITVRVVCSIRRPDSEPSRMYSDSGVVTTMCGGRLRIALRSACGVSPVRTAVRISTSGKPVRSSSARMPSIGSSRLIRTSLDSAFNGDTYTTDVSSASVPATPSWTSSSIAARKAASVLPDPVGAAIRTLRPARMAGHASRCASVGCANVRSNQAVTAGWKICKGMVIRPLDAPQVPAASRSRSARPLIRKVRFAMPRCKVSSVEYNLMSERARVTPV